MSSFIWQGREMTGAVVNGKSYTILYNDEGIRTSKTKSGVTTTYYLNGSQIISEETSGTATIYLYDAAGRPAGMKCYSNSGSQPTLETYWFDHNLQGDVIGVYSKTGTKLASYVYDAWGNFTVTYSNGGASIPAVVKNPFRYRGYYYDVDLGLYYLQSRYYDANTGRFISPDDVSYLGANGDLNSYNLYAYCSNNPVMYADPSGHGIIFAIVVATLVGAIVGGGSNVVSQLRENGGDWGQLDWGSVANSSIVGGALGFSLAMGVHYLGPVIAGTATYGAGTLATAFATSVGISAVAGGVGYITEEAINGRASNISVNRVAGNSLIVGFEGMISFGTGGMVGSFGKIGAKGTPFSKEWWGKFILGQEFSYPSKYLLNKLRKEAWGK